MGYEKFLGKAFDIFTGFSCERFLGISADFPQNCYLGRDSKTVLNIHWNFCITEQQNWALHPLKVCYSTGKLCSISTDSFVLRDSKIVLISTETFVLRNSKTVFNINWCFVLNLGNLWKLGNPTFVWAKLLRSIIIRSKCI